MKKDNAAEPSIVAATDKAFLEWWATQVYIHYEPVALDELYLTKRDMKSAFEAGAGHGYIQGYEHGVADERYG